MKRIYCINLIKIKLISARNKIFYKIILNNTFKNNIVICIYINLTYLKYTKLYINYII